MNQYSENSLLEMLKALADDSRLTLIRVLNDGERTVGDLAGLLNLGEPTISHHLSKLRENGLVNLRMAGNQRFYRVNETGLERFQTPGDGSRKSQTRTRTGGTRSRLDQVSWLERGRPTGTARLHAGQGADAIAIKAREDTGHLALAGDSF